MQSVHKCELLIQMSIYSTAELIEMFGRHSQGPKVPCMRWCY